MNSTRFPKIVAASLPHPFIVVVNPSIAQRFIHGKTIIGIGNIAMTVSGARVYPKIAT
jgi:hypothetical protein